MKNTKKTGKPLPKCCLSGTKDRIVTSEEKWIYFESLKRKRSWVTPGGASTSFARPSRYGKRTLLCVWWDHEGVIYDELLKSGETVNTKPYRQ